ncbi:MAG TPA: polysaccharide deacetylase family protein [Cyclobacteriaceae bacterium]
MTPLKGPIKFFTAVILLFSCTHPKKSPGICLSFDDRSVHQWTQLKPLLNSYNAHVTFFITQYDSLTTEERRLLKGLHNDGHEIGSHGAMHVFSETYIKQNSYEEYLENEIDNNIATLKANGFNATSFAYPYGSKYWLTDLLLLKRFNVLRGVAPISEPIQKIDDIFYDFDNDQTLFALGFDEGVTIDKLEGAFDRAVENNEVLMLYAHAPDKSTLEEILSAAKKRGMTFYRFNDLITSY